MITRTKKKINNRSNSYIKTPLHPQDFEPMSYEEEICKEIALSLEEKDIRYILSIFDRYGLRIIEEAWGIFESIDRGQFDNGGSFFNYIIKNLLGNTWYRE